MLDEVRSAKASLEERLMGVKGFLGAGIGQLADGRLCLNVYVAEGVSAADLNLGETAGGIPLVVEEVGEVISLPVEDSNCPPHSD